MSNTIKIVIADDQRLMREGLKTILDLEEDMEVLGTAGNGKEALELCRRLTPDVVLLPINDCSYWAGKFSWTKIKKNEGDVCHE